MISIIDLYFPNMDLYIFQLLTYNGLACPGMVRLTVLWCLELDMNFYSYLSLITLFKPTCADAWWALKHRFLSVCLDHRGVVGFLVRLSVSLSMSA